MRADFGTIESDIAIAGIEQPGDQANQRRLAAAGLTDEAYRLPWPNRKINAVHGM